MTNLMDEPGRPDTFSPASLREALDGWREALGPDHVITEPESLEVANQATFATAQRSPAILKPGNRDEVAASLKIAQRFRVPLYPISTGRNWGYGSGVPAVDGSVLLSLARLDRITDFDEKLAYVTVEPGVTFRRLAEFLAERHSRLLPPLTGTSPDASLIGNVLERGIGKGPYENIASRSCAYEVVLASGRILQTGFAGLPGAQAAPLWAHGPGPSLQGLFSQSNLGIVTRMTLWLEPAPQWRQQVLFRLGERKELSPVIDVLRETLQRSGGPELQVELMNDYRFLAQNRQYPYEEFDGMTSLPRAWVEETLRSSIDARWIGCVTLWAEHAQALETERRALTEKLQPVVTGLQCEEPTAGRDAALSHSGLQSAYWRKRQPMPAEPHPDRNRCGVMWLVPVIPMLGPVTEQTVEEFEEIMLAHGFEPSISLRCIGGRALQVVLGLFYDRDTRGADERAAQCYDELRAALYQRGLYPYRLGLRDMDSLPRAGDGSEELLRALKRLLDPHGILAPGRYIP